MRQVYMGSWVRMVLAFAAVLLVAGPGLVMAAGPNPTYTPKSSVLIGPTSVSSLQTANYTLRVTFTNNMTADFPPTTGASFSAYYGTITSNGVYTSPASMSGTKDRLTGTFIQNGAKVTSSLVVVVAPLAP